MDNNEIAPVAAEANEAMRDASTKYSTELGGIEQLAVAQALYKAMGEVVSTKDPDSLRSRADEEYLRLYAETGAKSFDVRIGGEKVGTMSVREPKRSAESVKLVVDDREAAKMALGDFVSAYIDANLQDAVQWVFDSTGEVLDGCTALRVGGTVGEPTTALRVDPQKVSDALRGELPAAVQMLLEGGR